MEIYTEPPRKDFAMGIITIGREFGSGGRELGHRLAEELGYEYYDKEIVDLIAKKSELDENYVAYALDGGMFRNFPIHFGRTFSYSPTLMANETKLLAEQNKLLKELATKGNCVIVGRAADVILRDYNPFRIFVYADIDFRTGRTKERHPELKDSQVIDVINKTDKRRSSYYNFYTGNKWGKLDHYDMALNSSTLGIEGAAASIIAAAKRMLEE